MAVTIRRHKPADCICYSPYYNGSSLYLVHQGNLVGDAVGMVVGCRGGMRGMDGMSNFLGCPSGGRFLAHGGQGMGLLWRLLCRGL